MKKSRLLNLVLVRLVLMRLRGKIQDQGLESRRWVPSIAGFSNCYSCPKRIQALINPWAPTLEICRQEEPHSMNLLIFSQ